MMEEKYMKYDEALKEVRRLHNKHTIILGIERFVVDNDDYLVPDISGIADFSDATHEESYTESLSYFEEYGQDSKELFVLVADD